MLNLACNNKQKIKLTASPDNPLGGPLGGTVVSGNGTVEPDPTDALSCFVISDSGPAAQGDPPTATVFKIGTDADPGPDDVPLFDDVRLLVSLPPLPVATTLGLTVGSPEPK